MALTQGQRAVVSWSGFLGAVVFIFAAVTLDDERRHEAELERARELAAAAQAGAIAATVINAAAVDGLQAADVSDVVLAHVRTFHGPDAPRAGECAC